MCRCRKPVLDSGTHVHILHSSAGDHHRVVLYALATGHRRGSFTHHNAIPVDFIAQPVISGEGYGQESHRYDGRDGRQGQCYSRARHLDVGLQVIQRYLCSNCN